ncbi:putative ISXo8 transposase [Xanthomonas oryzae pv. oryzae KACC 10331]|uniref:ISXo8 transposase n=1 Tax=Xanthomonas oryzae pv. oryzae (strain KACC10331 / KXO85) TaxID=291331 RepID=Q05HW9_XANOR|nr:putative ISXo8 transposase [Xanthomonas oryzae pv. oryzae KACC 10331]
MKSRSACPQGRIGRSAGARAATQRSVRGSRRCGVRAAHNRQAHDEQWLLIEWPPGESEPRHYWFSTRPKQTPVKTLGCHGTRPMGGLNAIIRS